MVEVQKSSRRADGLICFVAPVATHPLSQIPPMRVRSVAAQLGCVSAAQGAPSGHPEPPRNYARPQLKRWAAVQIRDWTGWGHVFKGCLNNGPKISSGWLKESLWRLNVPHCSLCRTEVNTIPDLLGHDWRYAQALKTFFTLTQPRNKRHQRDIEWLSLPWIRVMKWL